MTWEVLFGASCLVIIALSFLARLIPQRKPPTRFFKCARCNTTARHTSRTIEAWRQQDRVLLPGLPCKMVAVASPARADHPFRAAGRGLGLPGCSCAAGSCSGGHRAGLDESLTTPDGTGLEVRWDPRFFGSASLEMVAFVVRSLRACGAVGAWWSDGSCSGCR